MLNLLSSSFVGIVAQAEASNYDTSFAGSIAVGISAAVITQLCLKKLSSSSKLLASVLIPLAISELNAQRPACQFMPRNPHRSFLSFEQKIEDDSLLPFQEAIGNLSSETLVEIDLPKVEAFMKKHGENFLEVYRRHQLNNLGWKRIGSGLCKWVYLHEDLPEYVFKIHSKVTSEWDKDNFHVTEQNSLFAQKIVNENNLNLIKVPRCKYIKGIRENPIDVLIEEYIPFHSDSFKKFVIKMNRSDEGKRRLDEFLRQKTIFCYLTGFQDLHPDNFGIMKNEKKLVILDTDRRGSPGIPIDDWYRFISPIPESNRKIIYQTLDELLFRENVNFDSEYGYSLLQDAIDLQEPELVKLILKHGANVNGELQYEYTPLSRARIENDSKILKVLVEHGARE